MAAKRRIADAAPVRGVTVEAWLKALLDVRQNGNGLTTREWAERLGVSEKKTLNLLKRAEALGCVRHGKRQVDRFGGGRVYSPCYEVVLNAKEAKGG